MGSGFWLQELILKRPENVFLASEEGLKAFVSDAGFNGSDERSIALAELVVRWCLSANEELSKYLADILPDWNAFVQWYLGEDWGVSRELPSETAKWRDPEGIPGCEARVRERLKLLFQADGFIPVYDSCSADVDKTWFIPFILEISEDSVSRVVYSNGEDIPEWQEQVEAALKGLTSYRCRLLMQREPGFNPTGDSLMLPLRLAAWRKLGRDSFPQYDVFRVLATGAFDGNNRLKAVGVSRKLNKLKSAFCKAVLIAPDAPGEVDQNDRAILRIDCGALEDELREQIQRFLERSQYSSITWRYALGRLSALNREVDVRNRGKWCEQADFLRRINECVKVRNPDAYLDFLRLYAVTLCHAGKTDESRRVNRTTYDFALGRGEIGKALRLQVEAIVVAQDAGDLESIRAIADGFEKEIEGYAGPKAEKDDLCMRYHGTMMQFHAWGETLGVSGCSKEESKRHGDQALAIALEVSGSVPASDTALREAAESNVAQDRNYCHLWYALYEPGTMAEQESYESALTQLSELEDHACRKNRDFLFRQKSLAYLNAWKRGGKPPSIENLNAVLIRDDECEGWLIATNRTHLGALYAAKGRQDLALMSFDEGAAKLPIEKCFDSVLGAIRFVLCAQAASSLRAIGMDSDANRFVELTDAVADQFAEKRLFQLMRTEKWREMLQRQEDPRMLPRFYY